MNRWIRWWWINGTIQSEARVVHLVVYLSESPPSEWGKLNNHPLASLAANVHRSLAIPSHHYCWTRWSSKSPTQTSNHQSRCVMCLSRVGKILNRKPRTPFPDVKVPVLTRSIFPAMALFHILVLAIRLTSAIPVQGAVGTTAAPENADIYYYLVCDNPHHTIDCLRRSYTCSINGDIKTSAWSYECERCRCSLYYPGHGIGQRVCKRSNERGKMQHKTERCLEELERGRRKEW